MSRSLFTVITVVLVSLFLGFFFWSIGVVFDHNTSLYLEYGLIENIQSGVLGLCFLVYLLSAIISKGPAKFIMLFLTLLCYAFVLREMPLWKLDIPQIFIILGSGTGRNITEGIAFLLLVFYGLKNFSRYKQAGIDFIRSKPGYLFMAAGLFLCLGGAFEEMKWIDLNMYYEEICELFGYILILLSALATIPYINTTRIEFGQHSDVEK